MRGSTARQVTMLALVDPDQLIRDVKPIVEEALKELEPVLAGIYSEVGRRSIPPEDLLKACLLMAFYSIRSERQFCERLRYDLLFKWFLGLNVEDEAFDHSSFASRSRTWAASGRRGRGRGAAEAEAVTIQRWTSEACSGATRSTTRPLTPTPAGP
jgi:hypothetical protein